MSRYHGILLGLFAAVWTWAAIEPRYPHDWLLENYLVFMFVPLIVLTGRYFRLSNLSYTLMTAFMLLHVVGSHYTYAEVPFGATLQDWFGSGRNMYDRLVHFGFGLLLVDMGLAVVGAAITLLVVALVNWRYDPEFGRDLRASLKIGRGDKPLGEHALRTMLRRKRKREGARQGE